MKTLQAKLIFNHNKDIETLKDLTRRWSSAYRYAYNRLLEGLNLNSLRKSLQTIFHLNARYAYSALIKAQALLKTTKELNKSPKKIIFGGRNLFEKLKKRHINGKRYEELKREWYEKRKGRLYSIGQENCKGNQNTRIEIREDGLYLRIQVGKRQYLYARISAGDREEEIKALALSGKAYTVEIKLKKGKFYAYFTAKEEYPAIEITKDYGVIGIDFNVYPSHIAWAETDEFGNFLAYGEIPTPELCTGNSNKRDYYAWIYAHKITEIAKEKGKAIVIEELRIKDKGRRGDYSGRRIRWIRHNFAYRKLLERIEILAKRKGIEVIEVDSAYTSVIGMLKYAPQYMVSKDVGSAYVIARRGLGLEERIPKTYRDLLEKIVVGAQHAVPLLEELRDYIREKVGNRYLREKHLKEIEDLIESFESLESEPGRVSKPLGGTSLGIRGNPWRVLRVVVLTARSPERVLRDFSILKRVLLQGKWGDPLWARVPVAGDRGVAYGFT